MIPAIRSYASERARPLAYLSAWLAVVWWIGTALETLRSDAPQSYVSYSGGVEPLLTLDAFVSGAGEYALVFAGLTPVALWFIVDTHGVRRATDVVLGSTFTLWLYLAPIALAEEVLWSGTVSAALQTPSIFPSAAIQSLVVAGVLLWGVAPVVVPLLGLSWYGGVGVSGREGSSSGAGVAGWSE